MDASPLKALVEQFSSASSDSGSDEEESEMLPPTPLTPSKSPSGGRSPGVARPAVARRVRTTSSSEQQGTVVHAGTRTIYTAGRPPWYDTHGQLKEAFVIGICGGSASGKTTVARRIIESLDVQWVSLLSMDSFYREYTVEEKEMIAEGNYNFDHPDAFDFDLLVETLQRLKEGKSIEVPIYNFKTHSRDKGKKTIYGANVVIFEGILAFTHKELLKILDMKIFVDTDSDIRLARRLKRDISDRGREIEGVIAQYQRFVKPAFEHYIEPTMALADIIVPRGGENEIAINLIVTHVHQQLSKRGFKLRSTLRSAHVGQPLPKSLCCLETTAQVKGMHTFIRNRDTSRDEFIFYSKRLMRLLIEYALSMMPFQSVTVTTPHGLPYEGKRMCASKICGVSVLRAGETMEPALSEVFKNIRLGKILIQTNLDTGEPELHYLRLPKDIKEHYVMLMDATVATGAAAMMAIRVLLDHDVPEENIMLLSLIMAESGVHSLAYAFPGVRLVTTAVDPEVNERFHILPGIGNFGDRYFGTEAQTSYVATAAAVAKH